MSLESERENEQSHGQGLTGLTLAYHLDHRRVHSTTAMASLTSARARRGAGRDGSVSPVMGGGAAEFRHDGSNGLGQEQDEEDNSKDKDGYRGKSTYPPTLYPEKSPAPSSRPFGSTTPSHSNHHHHAGSTSGWITSGNYVDKGKSSKPQRASSALSGSASASGMHENGKTGSGPLRLYGGGLGSVSHGEFKLLIVVTLLASVVRLWKLDRPASVVFDEVHFGGVQPKLVK